MKNAIIIFLVFVLFCCEHDTIRLERYEIHGIDVSHYQNIINWDTVFDQEIRFAFVKATEGLTFHDNRYCFNWEEMKRVGIKRGAYHFFRPSLPADEQAQNFIGMTDIRDGDLPPVLDVEVMDGVTKSELIKGIKSWIDIVESEYQVKPIIYSNVKFYNRYLAKEFEDYPLWIARYNRYEPRLRYNKVWEFWQYGNKGQINGIEGMVDFNVFRGTYAELEALCIDNQPILSSAFL